MSNPAAVSETYREDIRRLLFATKTDSGTLTVSPGRSVLRCQRLMFYLLTNKFPLRLSEVDYLITFPTMSTAVCVGYLVELQAAAAGRTDRNNDLNGV